MIYVYGTIILFGSIFCAWIYSRIRRADQLERKQFLDQVYLDSKKEIDDKSLSDLVDDTNKRPRGHA